MRQIIANDIEVMVLCGKEMLVERALVRVARLDAEGYDFVGDPEVVVRTLISSGVRADLFTFIQQLSNTTPQYEYLMEWDNMAALKISTYDRWMMEQIDFKTRNKVRKAAKSGVITREVRFDDKLVSGIAAIYNEAPVRQGKKFWHYGKDAEQVWKMNSTFLDRSIFIGAFFEDELIGFIKLVINEDKTQAGLMQIISMIRHRDKAPNNALVAQAVRSCAERFILHLWYAKFTYGNKQQDSLADFKRHNGFQKVNVPRYYIPLTRVGRLALRLGLHHGIEDWIPGRVIAVYRDLRSRWYATRFPNASSSQH